MTMTTTGTPGTRRSGREVHIMETPEDVAAMLRLKAAGWGTKRIARELGCARNTVKRYCDLGGWQPYAGGARAAQLDGLDDWLRDALVQHGGNAEVVRQELAAEKEVRVGLRTVQRAVRPHRRELRAQALATVRFETRPGEQAQVDFGQRTVVIGGERVRVHLCVVVLGWSRRVYVRAFRHERQGDWFTTIEEAFRRFGGVPAQLLVDNPRALVEYHDRATGEIRFNKRFSRFAQYWGFTPRACAPFRARTKGKVERGVGYVKKNALAGREFESWAALEAWLDAWCRDVADERVHGTTGERPRVRFEREEAAALQPHPDKPSFLLEREVVRRVHADGTVEIDRNAYSVPWTLGGAWVTVRVSEERVVVSHGEETVAEHVRLVGVRQRQVDPAHWKGLARGPEPSVPTPEPEFLRPLAEYAALANGEAA